MAALRFIASIEANNQHFIHFWDPASFHGQHRHARPFHSGSTANWAVGLLWVEMANRWVPTLVCIWVLLGNFTWIQRSLESEPWQDGMLKLQDKKQTNLTPTLHDGSDNCEIVREKKRENHWMLVRGKHLVVQYSVISLCEVGRLKPTVSFSFSNSLLPLKIHGVGTSVAHTKHSNCFWKERFASGKCAVSLIANVVDCEENERMTYDMTC